jgi:hypothetical protein
MIHVAKSPLNAPKLAYLCRWRDVDGHQHM